MTAAKSSKLDVLRNPWLILASIVLGGFFGYYERPYARMLGPYGDLYLELLKMFVLPYLLVAVIVSVGTLLGDKAAVHYVRRIIIVSLVGLCLAGAVGAAVSLVVKPGGGFSETQRSALGAIIGKTGNSSNDLEISLAHPQAQAEELPVAARAIGSAIPSNIFASLSDGDALKVLFFAILFGVGLGKLPDDKRAILLEPLTAASDVCLLLMRWFTYPLPFALFAMAAAQLSRFGLGTLVALKGFVLAQVAASIALFVLGTLLICLRLGKSPFSVILALEEPIFMAFGTRSSLACIPATVVAMTQNLGLQLIGARLVVPLVVTLVRFGPACYYAVCTIFITELYGRDLGTAEIAFVVLGSVLAAIASIGTTSALTITFVSLICGPLRLPFDAAVLLFIAADAIVDPFRTVSIVYGNCAATAWVVETHAAGIDDRPMQQTQSLEAFG